MYVYIYICKYVIHKRKSGARWCRWSSCSGLITCLGSSHAWASSLAQGCHLLGHVTCWGHVTSLGRLFARVMLHLLEDVTWSGMSLAQGLLTMLVHVNCLGSKNCSGHVICSGMLLAWGSHTFGSVPCFEYSKLLEGDSFNATKLSSKSTTWCL